MKAKGMIMLMLRTLRNFLILNLFVLLPLGAILLWHYPEQLFLSIETSTPLSVGVGECQDGACEVNFTRSAGCALNVSDRPSAHLHMAQPNNADRFAYRFIGDAGTYNVRGVHIVRHLIVKQSLSADDILENYEADGDLKMIVGERGECILRKGKDIGFLRPKHGEVGWGGYLLTFSLVTKKTWIGLVGLEFLLVMLGAIGILVQSRERVWRTTVTQAVILSLAGGVFVFVILPLQTLLANQSEFTFEAFDVLGACLVSALILSIYLLIGFIGASLIFKRMLMAAFVGWLLFEYLQTGMLSAGYPSLNGDVMFYRKSVSLMIRDYVLLSTLMVLPVVFYKYVCNYLHWIALGVLILAGASLFDVKPKVRKQHENPIPQWKNVPKEVVNVVKLSSTRNIIMLIPDTTQGDVACAVARDNPEIKNLFQGFTAFVNNVGMHEFTLWAMPGLLTGRHWDGLQDPGEYGITVASTNSLISQYSAAQWATYAVHCFDEKSYTNQNPEKEDDECKVNKCPAGDLLLSRQKGTPYLNLFDIVTFRLAPFALKEKINAKNVVGLGGLNDLSFESSLYPLLETAPTATSGDHAFHVYWSNGLHTPLMFDRQGNQAVGEQNYTALYDQCYFVLSRIGHFCAVLRERGLYDQTMIIVAADHGSGVSSARVLNGDMAPGRLFPMLWVKPFKAQGDMTFDETPTSHSRVHDMVVRSMNNDLTAKQISEMLRTENRLYRNAEGKDVNDWHVDATGRVSRVKQSRF